jgi:hypothetical protein
MRLGLAAFSLVVVGFVASLASADPGDPFVGSRTLTLFGDDNIKDGVQLDSIETNFAVSTSDGLHYTVAITAGNNAASLSMVRNGNLLSLNPRPQGTMINCYMFSDGANGAFLMMGQEVYDPLDISFRVATWAQDAAVLPSQLVGDWEMTWIQDNNLRSGPQEPFTMESRTLTVTDLGGGKVGVQPGFGGNTWVMQINGSVLEPDPGTLDAALVYLSMKSDGHSIAIAGVGVEPWDATDVSVSIAFFTRLPFDWNGDGITSIIGDVPSFVNCVYFGNQPSWSQDRLLGVGDCNHDSIISIIGDVPCFVDCVYFGNCEE